MKKLFLIAIAAAGMMTAQAQQALEAPSFGSNWSVGIEGGGITPLYDGSSFIGDMRGGFGVRVQKQISTHSLSVLKALLTSTHPTVNPKQPLTTHM